MLEIANTREPAMTNLSPLGRQLQKLMDSGAVTPSPMPFDSTFPTARVVVPVYNSNGTSTVQSQGLTGVLNAELARRT